MQFNFSNAATLSKQIFWTGVVAIIPLTITIALLVWMLTTIDALFGYVIIRLFPNYYFEGLGILIGLLFVFIVGIMLKGWAARRIQEAAEDFIQRIPFVKTLYNGVRDLLTFFHSKEKPQQRVVLVTLPIGRVVAFLTRETLEGLPTTMNKPDEVIVYIPLSYQIGGLTLMVPRATVEPLDMSVEEAMRFVVLAGMAVKSNNVVIPE